MSLNFPVFRRSSASEFLQADSGASTVEFVILLPFMISFLALVAAASLYFAMASDVQQLAHELARSALPVLDEEDWCEDVTARMVTPLAENLPLLDAERVQGVECALDEATGIASVTVDYNLQGTLAAFFGRLIGMDFSRFVRHSFVQS